MADESRATPVELTQKQKKFADYLIKLGRDRATEAAKLAGYSEKSARQSGYANMQKASVKAYIEERLKTAAEPRERAEAERKLVADGDEVLRFLSATMRGEVKDQFGLDAQLKDRLAAAKELFTIGMNFFTLQISGVVLFFSSNIIISKLFSPSMVTPYQIAHRYFMVAMLLFTIICTPYWSATTDAYERKDYGWIKKANKTLNRFMIFICICIALMILLSDFIYGIWIGGKADIPLTMTIIVGVYELVLIWSARYSLVLNGIGV